MTTDNSAPGVLGSAGWTEPELVTVRKDDWDRMKAYIAERDAETVTLCCVCEQPVWPSLTLWQQAEGRTTSYGHRRCLDATYSDGAQA